MKTYKGFEEDFTCRGYQYEIGKTETHEGDIEICMRGFHSCEIPLDVWSYYPPNNSVYAVCEIPEKGIQKMGLDSKVVSPLITITKKLQLKELIEEQVEVINVRDGMHSATNINFGHSATTESNAHSVTSGRNAHSATAGYNSHSSTTGKYAHSITAGYNANSATIGKYADSATVGNCSHSVTTGFSAHSATIGINAHSSTTGDSARSVTVGNRSQSSTTGSSAHSVTVGIGAYSSTAGDNARSISAGDYSYAETKSSTGIAEALGKGGKVKGVLGSHLACGWWKEDEFKGIRNAKITKKSHIRPNRWYIINKEGKWKEVKNENV